MISNIDGKYIDDIDIKFVIDDDNEFNIIFDIYDINDIIIVDNIMMLLKKFNNRYNIDNKYISDFIDEIYSMCDIKLYNICNDNDEVIIINDYIEYYSYFK